jgi:ABC-type bacteriocin/lantibiotic exporter with double-glycine peptidase domain
LASVAEDAVLLHDSVTGRPASVARPTFEAEWDGNVILLARRASLADLGRRFDITWFLQAMHKYRGLLSEVVVASFFIQVFALITPIFFQVVIDKVLVHRGITTLNVLIFGLVSLSIFESLLTGLRTHVFAHTTMRRIARGRTVLIIAHRLSTVRRADRIITLEAGKIVEDGTHEALLTSGGRYAHLHALQAGLHDDG